jgi:hypothetical protein
VADQGDLQFDRAEPAQGQAGLTCAACHRSISDTYFEVNGQVVCASCRRVLEDQWHRGGSAGRFGKALGLGLLAATGSAVVWYAVLKLTDSQWGILAVVVGLAVGAAVSKGANGRGGWRYQTLAIVLTYTAIVSSYVPLIIDDVRERSREETQPSAAPSDSLRVRDSATVTAAASTDAEPGLGTFVLAVGALMALFYATPILVGVQSPIALLIVGIALYEAWKLNKKVELRITGPYQVAGGAAPA